LKKLVHTEQMDRLHVINFPTDRVNCQR